MRRDVNKNVGHETQLLGRFRGVRHGPAGQRLQGFPQVVGVRGKGEGGKGKGPRAAVCRSVQCSCSSIYCRLMWMMVRLPTYLLLSRPAGRGTADGLSRLGSHGTSLPPTDRPTDRPVMLAGHVEIGPEGAQGWPSTCRNEHPCRQRSIAVISTCRTWDAMRWQGLSRILGQTTESDYQSRRQEASELSRHWHRSLLKYICTYTPEEEHDASSRRDS